MPLCHYETIARPVLLALYDTVDHKLYNFHTDLTNICNLLQNLLMKIRRTNIHTYIYIKKCTMKIQASLNEHVKGKKFRKWNKIPRTTCSVLTYVFGHNIRNSNVLTTSSCLPFIRKTPDVCVLDTAWKLKPQYNTLYLEQSHRTDSCQTILCVSLKTSNIYIRNSRHYYSGKN
jgi:hypothetical protein